MRQLKVGETSTIDQFLLLYHKEFVGGVDEINRLLPDLIKEVPPDQTFFIEDGGLIKTTSLLHLFADEPQIEYKLLFENKVDSNQYIDGHSPLHLACCTGNKVGTKLLLENGADPNLLSSHINCYNASPLHYAALGKPSVDRLNVLELLIEHGANIHRKDANSENPLHYACYSSDLEGAKFLAEQGCDYGLLDCSGQLPVDRFLENGLKREFLEYLAFIKIR